MAKDVYCVINSYEKYFKVFDNLNKAKKDIVERLQLFSAKQIEENIKKESLLEKDVFLKVAFFDDCHYRQITPTKDMLFYFDGSIYNHGKNAYTKEYVLFSESDFTDFKDFFFFEGWCLVKTQIL